MFLSLLVTLWNSAFRWVYLFFSPLPFTSLLFSAICKASSDNHFAFWISFSWQSWSLPPVQCHKPPSIVLQALCLSNLIPWIYLLLPLYNHKGFDLYHICLWRRSLNQWTTVQVPSLQISLGLHTPHISIFPSFNCPLFFFGLYHHLHYLFSSSDIFLLSSANLFTIFANKKKTKEKWEQENNTEFYILFCRHIWINILHEILQNSEDILQSYLWNFVFLNIFILLQINGRSSHNFLIEYNVAFFNKIFFIISKSNTIS